MNLKQLEAFVRVAEYKNFSKAARELFLTQPTVSGHIKALEKELNCKLFLRNTREILPTKDGEKLYRYASQMVALQQKIEEVFLEKPKEEVTRITIAASTIPTQYLLPEIIREFTKKYPRKQFKILETDSAGVVEAVSGCSADVGMTGTILEKTVCNYIPICQDELVVVTPNTPKYRDMDTVGRGLRWIEQEPMIIREDGSGTRIEAEKLLKRAGVDCDCLNIVAEMDNPEAIKRSVCNGIGITVISRLAVQEEARAGKVLIHSISSDKKRRSLYLVYNKKYPLTRDTKRLLRVVEGLHLKNYE